MLNLNDPTLKKLLATCNCCEYREMIPGDSAGYCKECHEEAGNVECTRCGLYYARELGANGCNLCENCADDMGAPMPGVFK